MGAIAKFRTSMASAVVERIQWLREHGISFGGDRDLYAALGYERKLTAKNYKERYARGGIAGRIVDAYPNATWRRDDTIISEVFEEDDPDTITEFERAWQDLQRRLKIWSMFQRVDKLSGQGRYAVLLLGAPGVLTTELPKGKPESLMYLAAFSEEDAGIETYETNSNSERFGLPVTYTLKRADLSTTGVSKQGGLSVSVHWTRVIHVAENLQDNDIFGKPRLERVWNLIDDLEKVTGGGAEAFWLRANQGMQINIDKDAEFEPEDEAALAAEVDEYAHNQRRVMRTRAVDVKTLGSDVADFLNPADAIITQIAGALAIPKRILTGSEMGELASSQDADNWNTQVHDRRTGYAGPSIVHPFVDRLIRYGYLPTPKQYEVHWPPKQNPTEAETVALAKMTAEINGQFGGKVVIQPNEIREILGYEPIDGLDVDPEEEREREDEQAEKLVAALRKGNGNVLNLVVKP